MLENNQSSTQLGPIFTARYARVFSRCTITSSTSSARFSAISRNLDFASSESLHVGHQPTQRLIPPSISPCRSLSNLNLCASALAVVTSLGLSKKSTSTNIFRMNFGSSPAKNHKNYTKKPGSASAPLGASAS